MSEFSLMSTRSRKVKISIKQKIIMFLTTVQSFDLYWSSLSRDEDVWRMTFTKGLTPEQKNKLKDSWNKHLLGFYFISKSTVHKGSENEIRNWYPRLLLYPPRPNYPGISSRSALSCRLNHGAWSENCSSVSSLHTAVFDPWWWHPSNQAVCCHTLPYSPYPSLLLPVYMTCCPLHSCQFSLLLNPHASRSHQLILFHQTRLSPCGNISHLCKVRFKTFIENQTCLENAF